MSRMWEDPVESARALMRVFGVTVQYVASRDGDPGEHFAYTIGLTQWGHPELLVVGLSPDDSAEVLNTVAVRVRHGVTLRPGDVCTDVLPDDNVVIIAGPVEAAAEDGDYPIRIAREVFAEGELALPYQVTYPDAAGRFPWERGCELTMQPLLAPVPVRTVSANGPWRARAMKRFGRWTPSSWRWLHRLYAHWGGFFWLPCPLCERPFGGHELGDIDGMSSMIPAADGIPGMGQGICPTCTRAGRGVPSSVIADHDAD